jgi:hypothetical protein
LEEEDTEATGEVEADFQGLEVVFQGLVAVLVEAAGFPVAEVLAVDGKIFTRI